MSPAPDERSLRRYLLGTLPAEEAEAVEARYFGEGPAFEELLLAEDDLIDAYVAERLAPQEAQAFEAAFLSSPRRRERVEFARALRQAASVARAPRRATASPLLTAAALVACLAGAAWIGLRLSGAQAQLEAAREEVRALRSEVEGTRATGGRLAQELEAAARPVGGVATFTLVPGLTRAGTALPPLALAEGIEWVRLRLPVERGDSLAVEIQTPEGRVVWAQQALPSAPGPGRPTLDAMVPARALAPGTYVVLAKTRPGAEVASFPLRVAVDP